MNYIFYALFVVIFISRQSSYAQVERIANGETAATGQFPYQAGLQIFRSSAKYWCGGALIHAQWILTAAHCVKKAIGVTVFLGDTVRGLAKVNFYVPASGILLNAQFNENNMQNDVALIKLPKAVELSANIKTIQMTNVQQIYAVGQPVIVTGWGDLGDNVGAARELQFAQLFITDPRVCLRNYGSAYFNENLFCTYTPNFVSACRGDSGGPAVINNTLVGLVSFGSSYGCAQGYPVAFTKTSKYINWIELVTGIKFAQ